MAPEENKPVESNPFADEVKNQEVKVEKDELSDEDLKHVDGGLKIVNTKSGNPSYCIFKFLFPD